MTGANGNTSSEVSDGTYTDTTNPHLYTFTYDGSSSASGITIYVDGSAVASTASQDALDDSILRAESLTIGSSEGTHYMDGWMDDVRIYDKELTSTEVSNLYNAGAGTEWEGYKEGEILINY